MTVLLGVEQSHDDVALSVHERLAGAQRPIVGLELDTGPCDGVFVGVAAASESGSRRERISIDASTRDSVLALGVRDVHVLPCKYVPANAPLGGQVQETKCVA